MTFFLYLFILILATTLHFNKFRFIFTSVDGRMRNKSNNLRTNQTSKSHLRSIGTRIFGGYVAKDFKEYSYMTYLLRVTTERNATFKITRKESCGATLLSPTHALTAAHCLRKCQCGSLIDDNNCSNCVIYGVDEFTLYFGSIVPNNSVVQSKLKNIYIHPEHKYVDNTNKCLHRFDIAVLELATPIQFNDKISIIKLPEPVTLGKDNLKSTMTSSFFGKDMKCIILGWGLQSLNDDTPFKQEQLKVATVPLIELDHCKNEIKIKFKNKNRPKKIDLCTDTTICSKAPYDINGICHGDSGGPIICNGIQVGVSSWSMRGCVGPHIPNMYTRVDINVQWIRDIMSGTNITGRYMKIK